MIEYQLMMNTIKTFPKIPSNKKSHPCPILYFMEQHMGFHPFLKPNEMGRKIGSYICSRTEAIDLCTIRPMGEGIVSGNLEDFILYTRMCFILSKWKDPSNKE